MTLALACILPLLALTLALPIALPAPLHAAGAAAAFLVLPGLWLARRLEPGAPFAAHALTALTTTPFLVGAPAVLMLTAGMGPALAGRVLAVLAAALGFHDAVRRGARTPAAESPLTAAWLPAAVWAGTVAAFYATNARLAPRSDGWFHAAVTLQIAQRGVPVEDPDFGGLPLLYFWGYHAWASLWVALEPRLAVWTPLVAFQVAAAAAVMLGAGAVAARLGADRRGVRLAAVLAGVGYAPFAWLLIVARSLVGNEHGWTWISKLAALGADAGLHALAPGVLHISLAFFGDKYLVITSFGMGLALFAAFLAAQLDVIQRPDARNAARLALLVAAALFLHTVVGMSVLLVSLAWGAWLALRAARGEARARAALPPLALACAAAALLLSPYLFSVAHSKRDQLGWGLYWRSIASLLFPGALYVGFGAAWLARSARRVPAARELLAPAAALAMLGLALRLSEANQSKFLNLLFLALAAPAALGVLEAARGAWRHVARAGVALAVLPTFAFALWAFALEHGMEDEPYHRASRPAAEAWGWVRAHTPADALVADREGASDMQVWAGRDAMWAGLMRERDWGHPDSVLDLRRRAAKSLGAGRAPEGDVARFLAGLGRPVLVDVRTPLGADTSGALARALSDPRFEPLYRNPEIAVFGWKGAR